MTAQASTHEARARTSGAAALQTDGDQDEAMLQLFDGIAVALNSGDAAAIASAWETPALVVGDSGIHAVRARAEVESFFAGAREQYTSRGITATRAEIVRVSWVGSRTAIAEVRWPLLDERNRELGEERTTYTLRLNESGEPKIHAAVTHTPATH